MINIELFRLFGSILIEDREAIQTLKNVDKKGNETSTKLSDIADKGVKIGAAVVAGAGVAVGGLLALANGTSETAAKWLELSSRTNIGIESLQGWGYAAQMSGADVEKLEVGMKKLSDTMVDAQNGSASAKSAYEQLGISMSALSTMTPEQAFEKVMYSLADMKDGALKNSIGNDLLGKSYTELKPLLAEGASGMDELRAKAVEMGIVMSEDSVIAAEGFGDSLDDVKLSFEGIKNKIVADLLPKLSGLLDWVMVNMPAMQETGGKALEFISNTISFITDNANILIPVLGGLLGAFIALKIISVISGLMAAYTAFTTTATGAQLTLSAAMMANPIGLIIAAIAALIAIGIALYMNWDWLSAKAIELWEKFKETFNGIKTTVSDVFSNIATTILEKINAAKDGVYNAIEKIKSFFNFKWELPKIKMPHFKISGSFSLNPPKVPSFGVDWYDKGGIFNSPTIIGVGEKRPEIVGALDDFRKIVREEAGNNSDGRTINLNIGTLIADANGLKQLERKLKEIRLTENNRTGVIV